MSKQVLVSVVMITYGHEKHIREAIEGVLMQKGDFNLELIIANDSSPDATDIVISEMLKTHSKADRIRYIKHEKNIGMMPNFIFALQQAQGKYIALCDGDDYWTDPYKLQKQVDFLEANSDYVIHSGVAQILKENIITEEYIGLENEPKTFTVEHFYKQNNLVTCTVMFRNIISEFPKDFSKVFFGDWYLYTLLLKKPGLKAFRSTDVFSIYRIHSLGVMNSLSLRKNYQAHINHIVMLKRLTGYNKFSKDIIDVLNWYSFEKFKIELEQNKYLQMINTFFYNFYLVKFRVSIKSYLAAIKNKILK